MYVTGTLRCWPPRVPRKNRERGSIFSPSQSTIANTPMRPARIPGGFFKREGRMTEKEILTCRLIDRPLRPLFPEGYRNETQVIALVLSADKENDPDLMGITGASAALYCSSIPFYTPVAAVRVGMLDGEFVINPSITKLKESALNLTVAGTDEALVMVEAGAKEIPEDKIIEALEFGHGVVKQLIALQKELYEKINPTKLEVTAPSFDSAEYERIETAFSQRISEALHVKGKLEGYAALDEVVKDITNSVPEEETEKRVQAGKIYQSIMEKIFRQEILKDRVRPDGRQFNEVRDISAEISLLPRTHGSALFTRGETQALVTATLGTGDDGAAPGRAGGRILQAVHAALQFSSLQRRRGKVHARPRPSRNRPRRPGREVHPTCDA